MYGRRPRLQILRQNPTECRRGRLRYILRTSVKSRDDHF